MKTNNDDNSDENQVKMICVEKMSRLNLVFESHNSRNPYAGGKVEWYLPNLIGELFHMRICI